MRLVPTSLLVLATLASSKPLIARGVEKCKNLQANSNNGGRKIAIVVDESGSMSSSDPYNLRIAAAKSVNDWLISSKEAGSGKSADLVTVIGFDDDPRLLYGLGDPGGADSAIAQITILGGTFIAGGVDAAISQLNASGHDPTAKRSGIVVLTDGSDSSTSTLVDSINNAGSQGIRVSFGFLDPFGFSYQDPDVLKAIYATGGMYSTINGDMAQNAFVNAMIVNGLTDNDNPSSNTSTTVYNGLSVAFMLGSDGASTLTYHAEANEHLTFTVSSISAGAINVTATDSSGKNLGNTKVPAYSYSPTAFAVTASSAGNLDLKIQGKANTKDAMFIVGANSSIPLTNCTLGETSGKSGLSTGAKAGIGISVPIMIGLFAAGSYFAWKYWKGLPPKTTTAPSSYGPHDPPVDYKQPYVQTTDLPTPSPQPTDTHPGWSMPPPKLPQQPKKPGQPGDRIEKPDNCNYNQPYQPDPNQHPFNPNNPSQPPQFEPSHPTQAEPSHPIQGDPFQPSHPATDPTSTQPPQTDPYHPSQADPSHPTQADPSHPTQTDPSHPTQADPSHPTQVDPSHPTQADPSHPTQADPSHPTQADPNNPHNPGTDSNPAQPPQGDPNNPNQNPTDPLHPKRLPFKPRTKSPFPRFFGRRRKKDDEKENQNQQQGDGNAPGFPQFSTVGTAGVSTGSPMPVSYTSAPAYPQPAPQNGNTTSPMPMSYGNAPTYPQLAYDAVQYASPQQYQAEYQHSYASSQQYPTSAHPVPGSPPQQYAVSGPVYLGQGPLIQQFPQPPPSAGQDRVQQPQGQAYNVSPILQPALPAQSTQGKADIINLAETGVGSISRKPVRG